MLGLAEKLSDPKVKKQAVAALNDISKYLSLEFTLSQIHPLVNTIKNPKTLGDLFLWIKQSLLDHGIKTLEISSLVDSLKKGFLNSNQAVRASAIAAFAVLSNLSKRGRGSLAYL